METEQLMEILSEILEDQKSMNKAQVQAIETTQELKLKIEGIDEILKNQKPAVAQIDAAPFQETVNKAAREIIAWIQLAQEKKQTNNLKVFFESDAKKWAVILLVALTFLTYAFLFAIRR